MFTYEQASGRFLLGDGESVRLIAVGYAGAPGFVNDPKADHLARRGPLPKGRYLVIEDKHPRFAVPAFRLVPTAKTDMHGRSGFWIHGDNRHINRSASTGCIVLGLRARLDVRAALARGSSRYLEVVA